MTKCPPGHHGREGFVRLRDYPSISIFSPDFSSTVKWSSQTMIRSSQRFTKASSKASRCAGCCLIKSCSSLMRAICASLAAVSTVHFSRCSRSLKISSQSHHSIIKLLSRKAAQWYSFHRQWGCRSCLIVGCGDLTILLVGLGFHCFFIKV